MPSDSVIQCPNCGLSHKNIEAAELRRVLEELAQRYDTAGVFQEEDFCGAGCDIADQVRSALKKVPKCPPETEVPESHAVPVPCQGCTNEKFWCTECIEECQLQEHLDWIREHSAVQSSSDPYLWIATR